MRSWMGFAGLVLALAAPEAAAEDARWKRDSHVRRSNIAADFHSAPFKTTSQPLTTPPPSLPQELVVRAENGSVAAAGGDCQCTVNAKADLVWWFSQTLFHLFGRLQTITATPSKSYSFVMGTSSLDVAAGVKDARVSYVETLTWNTELNSSIQDFSQTILPMPVAASTIITTESEVSPIPTGTFGADVLKTIMHEAAEPTITIDVLGSKVSGNHDAPLLYATELEFAGCKPPGPLKLNTPVLIAGNADGQYPEATPTGPLDQKFIGGLPPAAASCVPGTWTAPKPTMVVVVIETYNKGIQMLVHREETDTGTLIGPSPTDVGPSPTNPPANSPKTTDQPAGPTIDSTPSKPNTPNQPAQPAQPAQPNQPSKPNQPSNPELVVEGNTTPAAPGVTPGPVTPVLTLWGQTVSAAAGRPGFVIDDKTLGPGDVITRGSTTISLDSNPNPSAVYINGKSQPLNLVAFPQTISAAGAVATQASNGNIVIQGQTIHPGQAVNIQGTSISLGVGGSQIIINGATTSLQPSGVPNLILNGVPYPATYLRPNAYSVAGQTLTPGGQVTVSGNIVSLAPGGTQIVINGATQFLPGYAPLTVGGKTFTGIAGTYTADGTTFTQGATLTVDGTTVALLQGGTQVVVNGKTSSIGETPSAFGFPTPKAANTAAAPEPTSSKAAAAPRRSAGAVRQLVGAAALVAAVVAC